MLRQPDDPGYYGEPPRPDGCAGPILFGLVMATLIIAGVLLLLV